MNLRAIHGFDWDSGNWPKCGKHGLAQVQIEYVIQNNPGIFADPFNPFVEQRFRAIGQDLDSRFILIVFTIRQVATENFIRPISARFMHEKEVNHYGKP